MHGVGSVCAQVKTSRVCTASRDACVHTLSVLDGGGVCVCARVCVHEQRATLHVSESGVVALGVPPSPFPGLGSGCLLSQELGDVPGPPPRGLPPGSLLANSRCLRCPCLGEGQGEAEACVGAVPAPHPRRTASS